MRTLLFAGSVASLFGSVGASFVTPVVGLFSLAGVCVAALAIGPKSYVSPDRKLNALEASFAEWSAQFRRQRAQIDATRVEHALKGIYS